MSKLNLSDNQDKDLNAKNAKFSAKVAKKSFPLRSSAKSSASFAVQKKLRSSSSPGFDTDSKLLGYWHSSALRTDNVQIRPGAIRNQPTNLGNSLLDIGNLSLDYGNDVPEKGNEPA